MCVHPPLCYYDLYTLGYTTEPFDSIDKSLVPVPINMIWKANNYVKNNLINMYLERIWLCYNRHLTFF